MKIAIASGKGGTGKTTVATNLAHTIAKTGVKTAYFDCDVEEPNGRIFLSPRIEASYPVTAGVPEVDMSKCTLCGKCGRICRFSGIVVVGKKVLTFPELCHHCGGCALVCPTGAIEDVPHEIGLVEEGWAGPVRFVDGSLEVGVSTGPPVVRAVKRRARDEDVIIMDAPPGTACPVVETTKDADVGILVTEPTPFGLNDLKLAVEMLRLLEVPLAVVINRAGIGDSGVEDYCRDEGIKVISRIPHDRRIAESYSRGELIVESVEGMRQLFEGMYERVVAMLEGVAE